MYSVLMNLDEFLKNPAAFAAYLFGIVGAAFVFFLVVIPLHNMIKYRVVQKCGARVSTSRGYLTMSPKVSFSAVGFFSTLILNFGFARPVRFNLRNFRRPGVHTCFVSLSGAAVYLVSFFVSIFTYCLFRSFEIFSITSHNELPVNAKWYVYVYFAFYVLLAYMRYYCIGSFLFNIIPIGPLDFSEMLYMFLPYNWSKLARDNESVISVLLFVFAFLTIGKPNAFINNLTIDIINPVRNAIMQLLGAG